MYNFYIFILIISLLNPISIFLKKDILNDLLISEELILSTIFLFIFIVVYYIVIEKKNIYSLWNKVVSNNNYVVDKLIVFDLIVFTVIILSGYILLNEKVIYGESLKMGCFLIVTLLLSCMNKQINQYLFLGVILIIFGIYFVEKGNMEI